MLGLILDLRKVAETTGLLQCLGEDFVFSNVGIGYGSTCVLHCLLEVILANVRYWVEVLVHALILVIKLQKLILTYLKTLVNSRLFVLDILGDAFSDGEFTGALTDLGQIGTGKALCNTGQVLDVDFWIDW